MTTTADRDKQIAEAEELFGDRLAGLGFAKGLYFGNYLHAKLPAYPATSEVDTLVSRLRSFCDEQIDAAAIDREQDIPRSVIDGLGRLGVLGACVPAEVGGLGLSQTSYCRLLEVIGGHCASTALFVNVQHSIGPRALVLFGTPEQQRKWLPKLVSGEWLCAFALTEPEAGSDAANVQTTATPTPDGAGFRLNGEKCYITSGGTARAIIVMARTPVEGSDKTAVTAFQVSPDMEGYAITEERMAKLGVRGTMTSRLRFSDMFVPRENVLGKLGRGLKVALTVLDYGRTTFGATCTGAAKFCVARSTNHVRTRVQFGRPLADFESVKEKIAWMHAGAYAMEAMTYQTAALIDSGEEDYMLETAMLKVFATDTLWRILDHTFQLHGGRAYFSDEPFERMIRDARINTIGEGSNDVLRVFIALLGMRDVGLSLEEVHGALKSPVKNLGRLGRFAGERLERLFATPPVEVRATELEPDAAAVGKMLGKFASETERLLRIHREAILDRQCKLTRIADAAMDLYACGCVLSRLDARLARSNHEPQNAARELNAGRHFMRVAMRRVGRRLAALSYDDEATVRFADSVLAREE
jgi:alkylation response protein AidB-like acyl-CoA dehydrogenase